MWLSKAGCDLNTDIGYQKVAESLRALPTPPKLIVVDTLHRFLLGDENSAQDAKGMLDACANLMQTFNCSVLLVHHTGVAGDAQHRARGSSAWRGALDIEISVVPAKGDKPIEIIQRKSKDAELAMSHQCELVSVDIPGWFDEDGEPVSSAVPQAASEPIEVDSVIAGRKDRFARAWVHGGCTLDRDGLPWLSIAQLRTWLTDVKGLKPKSIDQELKPGSGNRLIHALLSNNLIQADQYGYTVVDEAWSSILKMMKISL
jgi:hypothetical protein